MLKLSSSPCRSSIGIVPKKNRTWLMCIEYQGFNKITMKKRYLLPQINDLLNQLQDALYFTKLDPQSEHHYVRFKEEDAWKSTFKNQDTSKILQMIVFYHLGYAILATFMHMRY